MISNIILAQSNEVLSFLIVAVIVLLLALSVRRIILQFKNGGCSGCGGNCSGCGNESCKSSNSNKQRQLPVTGNCLYVIPGVNSPF